MFFFVICEQQKAHNRAASAQSDQHLFYLLSGNYNSVRSAFSVIECLTWGRGVAGSSLTGGTVLCP